jgi:hypothetical protein
MNEILPADFSDASVRRQAKVMELAGTFVWNMDPGAKGVCRGGKNGI